MTVVASRFERRHLDLYQTEPWATEALLRHVSVGPHDLVWEPAAGNHLMADVLRERGADVFTSDIAVYDRQHDALDDFLSPLRLIHGGFTHIITNPPYGKGNRDAVRFAELALKRCNGWVALLLTAKFDFGKTRVHLFRDNPRFWGKIALLDRIQWFPGKFGGTEDHCWLAWRPADHANTKDKKPPIIVYEGRDG